MSVMRQSDAEIVRAINDGNISSDDLASREGWKRICKARGRRLVEVDEAAWQDLCARRGYVQRRQNSRGF